MSLKVKTLKAVEVRKSDRDNDKSSFLRQVKFISQPSCKGAGGPGKEGRIVRRHKMMQMGFRLPDCLAKVYSCLPAIFQKILKL